MHLLNELSVVRSMCLPKGFKDYQAVSTSEMDLDNVDTKKMKDYIRISMKYVLIDLSPRVLNIYRTSQPWTLRRTFPSRN